MRTIAYLMSLVLVFMIPWENAVTFADWGTLSRIVGILTASIWLASCLITARLRKPHLFHVIVLVFLIWNIASVFWSLAVPQTIQRAQTYAQLALLSLILWDLYTTARALTAGLQAYVLGAWVTVASTIYNYLSGKEINAFSEGRYAGAGFNAVDVALILALGLPVALHLATSSGNGASVRILRIANIAFIPASLFAMTLTASRMSIFIILPFILYGIFIVRQFRPLFRFLILALFVASLAFLIYHIPQPAMERLGTTSQSISSLDLGGRVHLWILATEIFAQHPVLGVGSGALHPPAQIGHVVHNTYLSVVTELGLIGFSIFLILFLVTFYQATQQTKPLRWLWLTILAIWGIGAFVLTVEYTKQTWLFINLVLVSAPLFAKLHPFPSNQISHPLTITALFSNRSPLSVHQSKWP